MPGVRFTPADFHSHVRFTPAYSSRYELPSLILN